MENPFLPIKPKDPIPILFTKPQNPHQIPSKPTKPTSTTLSPNSPSKTHNPSSRQFTRLSRSPKLQEAILALENGSPIQPKTYISLLQSCIDSDSIDEGRRLHSSINSVLDPNPFVETKLVSLYAKCGTLEEARKVFDGMRERNLFAWSAMINGFSREQRWKEVVDLFFEMMREGVVTPDAFLLPKILQACWNTGDVQTGRLLHSIAVRCGFLDSSMHTAHVSNSILAMYSKCGELYNAKRYFEKMGTKDRVSWNSIISGYCQFGENDEALRLFDHMVREGIEPGLVTWNILISSYNLSGSSELALELMKKMESFGLAPDVFTWTCVISGFLQNNKMSQGMDLFHEMLLTEVKPNGMTVASVISACAGLKDLKKGKELHSYAVKIGGSGSVLVGNSLIDMYSKCSRLDDAQRVFDAVTDKDVFTWNSMIGGYATAGYCGKAYELFSKMESFGVRRNVVTWNVMISGYIQNGDEDQAMELFQRMERDGISRNTASWNTLIAGSLQNGHADKALMIFRQMQSNLVRPNSVTILSILPAFANLVSRWKVKEIHALTLRSGLQFETSVINALTDTYSNSGDIKSAQALFNNLRSRDLISWSTMISGYVLHGLSHLARDLLSQMKEEGIKPNQTIFANVISACSLDGMVKEGKELFYSMIEEHQLSPSLEHYAAVVDLLGRSGRLMEASEVIENMPVEPNSAVWSALLCAARVHGNVKIANLAAERLIRLEPKNTRIQRLTSFVQSSAGKSSDFSKLRRPKRESRISDSCGGCLIEVKNKVHTFFTGEQPAAALKAKLAEIDGMAEEIKTTMLPGFPDAKLNIEEEMEDISGIHSEKLAMAFGLINSSTYRSIRIIKSVKMCVNCHAIAKLISKVHRREILLKDPKCLHSFKDGKCSCRDYW